MTSKGCIGDASLAVTYFLYNHSSPLIENTSTLLDLYDRNTAIIRPIAMIISITVDTFEGTFLLISRIKRRIRLFAYLIMRAASAPTIPAITMILKACTFSKFVKDTYVLNHSAPIHSILAGSVYLMECIVTSSGSGRNLLGSAIGVL